MFLCLDFPVQIKVALVVNTVLPCVMFNAERDDIAVFVRHLAAVCTAENVMMANIRTAAHYAQIAYLPFFHALFILSSSAGVSVSIPSSFASATAPSINRLISAVL